MRLYITSLFILCLSVIVLAATVSRQSSASNETTRIEADQAAGVIRFVIDGQERAVLDAAGLHVHGDLEFTGKTVDIGTWPDRDAK